MNRKHTFTPNYRRKYPIVAIIVSEIQFRQQTTAKNTHKLAYYIKKPCLTIDTKSMLIMGFVRKNSSSMCFLYARGRKAQVIIRELFARIRASDFQHFLKWTYNGRFTP